MYIEFDIQSNFSFLQAASHPDEYVKRASELGYTALGLADKNTFSSIVRAHEAAKEYGVHFYPGCTLELYYEEYTEDEIDSLLPTYTLLAYPCSSYAYSRLCQLLTLGKSRTSRSACILSVKESLSYLQECALIISPPYNPDTVERTLFSRACTMLCDSMDNSFISLALTAFYQTIDKKHWEAVFTCSKYFGIKTVATNCVRFHHPERKALHDVLCCIQHKTSVQHAGTLLQKNAERYLKEPQEMQRLFKDVPHALKRSQEIASQLHFSVDQLRYEYPDAVVPNTKAPIEHLCSLTQQGAAARYPEGVPLKVQKLIRDELRIIKELHYEKYFLTCYDIVRFARSRNILCQGRGSAANSAVCYCLGITAVDPKEIDILFARFVSKEREEPPDIDIDFEHERREEVIQYIYETYGKSHAALTAEVVTFQARSAIREVGKACGIPHHTVDLLAKAIHRWSGFTLDRDDLEKIGLDPDSTLLKHVLELTRELIGFPRHLAQHVGGFIISDKPLHTLVPVCNAAMDNRYIIEWNKDDIEALGIFKIDILALGMLTCIRKALDFVNQTRKFKLELPVSFSEVPQDDTAVYDMLCKADTVGVFQVESRAQMSMLPRLRPRCFYDIVIEIAIVRPGPIQGKMVHPYLRRRAGLEHFAFPDKRVADILGKTYGVPIFQEQAMRLAIVLAEFTPGEAEALRRAMAAWKTQKSKIAHFKTRIIQGMQKNGYSLEFAETCLKQIQGFSEYGFPESHAVSFALLVYVSAWIKRHYPAEFAAALLNSQPMGFYQPAQIVSDARAHGVSVLPVCVKESTWDARIEYGYRKNSKLRLGMRSIKNIQQAQAQIIVNTLRENPSIANIQRLWQKAKNLSVHTLEKLAHADAFTVWGYARRDALWEIQALPARPKILDNSWTSAQTKFSFMPHTKGETIFYDYEHTGLSLRGHPLELARAHLQQQGVLSVKDIRSQSEGAIGKKVAVSGLVLFRQRPGTSKGVVFLTLEDEFGVANIVVMPPVFERYQKEIIQAHCLTVKGRVETNKEVLYIKAETVKDAERELPCE